MDQSDKKDDHSPEARRYHAEFVRHARGELDKGTFDRLHKKARNSAGGLASPKRGDVDPSAEGSADTQKSLVAKNADLHESFFDGIKAMWRTMFSADAPMALIEDGAEGVRKSQPGPQEVHVDVPEPLSTKKKRKKKKGQKQTETTEIKVVANKSAQPYMDLQAAVAETDGIDANNGPAGHLIGLDIHFGSGKEREPGFIGVDSFAYDEATIVHDLSLGAPFPDACARAVIIEKTAPDSMFAEAERVLMPEGTLLMEEDGKCYEVERAGCEDDHQGIEAVLKSADVHTPGTKAGAGKAALVGMTDERRALIVKSLDRTLPIVGISDHRQILYAPALVPDEVHCSLDWMTAEDIEWTAHQYLAKARAVGSEHKGPIDADIVESFIAPADLHFDGSGLAASHGPQSIPKGSWVVGVRVNDPAEWSKVVSGEYTGLSVGGFGLREALTED